MAETILIRTLKWPPKDPEEERTYGHEYEEAEEDPITASVWTVDGLTNMAEAIQSPHITTIKLGGGVDGDVKEVKNVVTLTSGEIIVRRVYLQIALR